MIFWTEKAYSKPEHLRKIKLSFWDPEKINTHVMNNQ